LQFNLYSLNISELTIYIQGYTDPNTEALSKPLPWTPLMCAVAINDLRSTKLLVRQGGDPNHPNKVMKSIFLQIRFIPIFYGFFVLCLLRFRTE
jgi:hypothetical protein